MKRKAHLHGGCEAAPGTRAAREIDRAWREGRVARIVPRKGEDIAAAFIRTSIESIGGYQNLPVGLRPGDKVGKRK